MDLVDFQRAVRTGLLFS